MKYAVINKATSATHEIIPAVANHSIEIVNITLISAGTVNVTPKSATTALSGAIPLIANSGFSATSGVNDGGIMSTAVGEAFNLTLDAAIQVSGFIAYRERRA